MYQKQWEFLKRKFDSSEIAHAYLLSGQGQLKIKSFAKDFIKYINCLSTQVLSDSNISVHKSNLGKDKTWEDKPCGTCQSCKLIEKGSFPDLLIIKSVNSESSIKNEKDMMEIDIGQIREVNNFLSYKSYYGNYKAIIIDNAERMNQEAQSCFLKTLEEPKGKTIIFLISSKPDLLLPTIFSRCQQIKFFYTGRREISEEERIILQNLLRIINSDLAEKFNYAKKINLEGNNFNKILEVFEKYLRNLLLFKIGAKKENSQYPSIVLNNYSVSKIKKIIRLIEIISYQVSMTNSSPKLALEILLMEL